MRQEIHLADQKNPGFPEHERVFVRFVIPLGDTEHHHLVVLSNIKFSRADEIADVFHNQKVKAAKVQILQRFLNHIGFKMASTAMAIP